MGWSESTTPLCSRRSSAHTATEPTRAPRTRTWSIPSADYVRVYPMLTAVPLRAADGAYWVLPTADGYIRALPGSPRQWKSFVDLIDVEPLREPEWNNALYRLANADVIRLLATEALRERSRAEVLSRLESQQHRRFIKTHTPLDGLPLDPRATYLVVARHPLDMAVSLFHQADNLDRRRMAELLGTPSPTAPAGPPRPIRDALIAWIDRDVAPADALDSLPGVLWHLSDAWLRRHDPNIVLLHYADLVRDLDGEMRQLAHRLGIAIPAHRWPILVEAASFAQMRARANQLVPDPVGIMKDRSAFFRRGSSGAGRELLSAGELARYEQRAAAMAPADFLAWLHR